MEKGKLIESGTPKSLLTDKSSVLYSEVEASDPSILKAFKAKTNKKTAKKTLIPKTSLLSMILTKKP